VGDSQVGLTLGTFVGNIVGNGVTTVGCPVLGRNVGKFVGALVGITHTLGIQVTDTLWILRYRYYHFSILQFRTWYP